MTAYRDVRRARHPRRGTACSQNYEHHTPIGHQDQNSEFVPTCQQRGFLSYLRLQHPIIIKYYYICSRFQKTTTYMAHYHDILIQEC